MGDPPRAWDVHRVFCDVCDRPLITTGSIWRRYTATAVKRQENSEKWQVTSED
jgi:hypothetical protein